MTAALELVSPVQPDVAVAQGDAIELMRQLPDRSVDLLLTDPPYESLEKHRAKGTTTRLKKSQSSSNAWFTIFPNKRLLELMTEAHRVLKPNSHAFIFCDEETLFLLKPIGEQAGFRFWKSLTWVKTKKHCPEGLTDQPHEVAAKMVRGGLGYHFRGASERIAFFEKGKRRLNDKSSPDVLFGTRAGDGEYPTQKPLGPVETLIRASSSPGDLVLDPFAGSGTTGVAARNLGRRAILFDLDVSAANERLGRRNSGTVDVTAPVTASRGACVPPIQAMNANRKGAL
jgi:site-specific DNA-methyltransferase (adenine-specific)